MSCFFGHNWIVVAFDEYRPKDGDYNHKERQIRFFQCAKCKARRVDRKGLKGGKSPFRLNIAAAAWQDHGYLLTTSEAAIIDDDYSVSKKSNRRYDYRPLNGIEEMVQALRNDPKFKKVSNHQMVADAMEELETVIKMHENLEVPE